MEYLDKIAEAALDNSRPLAQLGVAMMIAVVAPLIIAGVAVAIRVSGV